MKLAGTQATTERATRPGTSAPTGRRQATSKLGNQRALGGLELPLFHSSKGGTIKKRRPHRRSQQQPPLPVSVRPRERTDHGLATQHEHPQAQKLTRLHDIHISPGDGIQAVQTTLGRIGGKASKSPKDLICPRSDVHQTTQHRLKLGSQTPRNGH